MHIAHGFNHYRGELSHNLMICRPILIRRAAYVFGYVLFVDGLILPEACGRWRMYCLGLIVAQAKNEAGSWTRRPANRIFSAYWLAPALAIVLRPCVLAWESIAQEEELNIESLVRIEDLRVDFDTVNGRRTVVDGVSLGMHLRGAGHTG